jgi:hypothetical protein
MISFRHKTIRYLKTLILSLLFVHTLTAQNFNTEVEPSININENVQDLIEIVGTAKNLTNTNYTLKYKLSVIQNDINKNSSKNSQSGFFTLKPYETKNLSNTIVNQNSSLIVLLIIYNENDEIISTSRKELNGDKNKEKIKVSYKKMNEGIILKGLVTENTKTKSGKDFYDYFYQNYSLSGNQTSKIIIIDEIISYGRTTRLVVKVNDEIIYQFFAKPKLEYLKEQAEIAFRELNRYLQYLENRNEYTTQY